ncbi:MAG: GTPase, partial [Candidatus Methanomethylicota archaeon]
MIRIGLIGKTNTGKTTFFNAATLLNAEISTYPFTTKKPNIGVAYVQTLCVCREFKVKDNPQNSACINGWRFIPIELIDLPGLIKGAYLGRGLGNQFLSVAMQADALLHVVDASGSIDAEGRICEPGLGNPIADFYEVEYELIQWFKRVLLMNKNRLQRMTGRGRYTVVDALHKILSGMKVTKQHITESLEAAGIEDKQIKSWSDEDYEKLAYELRVRSKPTLIVANKMDLGPAEENYEKLVEEFGRSLVVPCSAEAELALRRAERAGLIEYVPGTEIFRVIDEDKLTPKQRWALNYVHSRVMGRIFRTGVQQALNIAVFKLLKMNVVYPVEDPVKLSDKNGNVLPDAFLMPPNSTVLDLAREIHSELAKGVIYAID